MSEKDFCWKCREAMVKKFNPMVFEEYPWLHCPHEQKEKEKCWCQLGEGDKWLEKRHSDGRLHQLNPTFCPECGKKLEG